MKSRVKQITRIRETPKPQLTSAAPDALSSRMMGAIVFPRTMESSMITIRLPLKFSTSDPNFLATPSCRNLLLGWINVRPT